MSLKFWSKKSSTKLSLSPALNKKLDHKLISQTQGKNIPSFKQLKYIGTFLSVQERKTLTLLTILIFLTGIMWSTIYFYTHLTRVPAIGGEYREALVGGPKYINPLFASANDVDNDITSLVYSGLFRYNEKRELVPDLASEYKVSSDGKTYDISLQKNIHWSDGTELTIDDVLYTFELVQNQEVESPLYDSFQGVEVKKTGDLSVRFILKQPFAPFLHSLTLGILPQHIWQNTEKLSTLRLAKANLQPIGTGPWKFDKLIKGSDGTIQSYSLSRNENYYGTKPLLKTLTFVFFPESAPAIQKVHSQDVSALAFPPRSQKDILNSRNLMTYTLELPQYTALFFNLQDGILKDKELRSALRTGINQDLIIKEALDGQGTAVNSPILSGMVGFNPDLKAISFNPDTANTLLDKKWTRIQPEEYFKIRKAQVVADYQSDLEVQYKTASSSPTSTANIIKQELASADGQLTEVVQKEMAPSQTFYRKDKNNNVLSLTITTLDTPEQQKTAEVLVRQWQLLGIHTTIQRVSAQQMSREILRGRSYQILLYGELVGGDPDPFPLWHSSQITYPGLNFTQFNNRTADKLLEDGRAATNPQARSDVYKKFQDLLTDEIPAIFLYSPTYSYVINKDVKGVEISKLVRPSDRFMNLSKWYTKTKLVWK